jgi:hypothetical protein
VITQQLRSDSVAIPQRFCNDSEAIVRRINTDSAAISSDFRVLSQRPHSVWPRIVR